jgi:serine O-acetyltransferase
VTEQSTFLRPSESSTVEYSYPPGGAAVGLSVRQLLALMREDRTRHLGELSRPGLHAIWLQRFGAWRLGLPRGIRRKAASALYHPLRLFVRNVYGIELFDTTRLGRRVWIAHQGGILIDYFAEVGDDCLIRQNATVVAGDGPDGSAPRLGRDVQLGVGAVVIGPVTVGDGAKIGPNAVVVANVPAGATAYAAPARLMPTGRSPRDGDDSAAGR